MTHTTAAWSLLALLAAPAIAAPSGRPDGEGTLTGRWLVTADLYGTQVYERLEVEQHGASLPGKFDGDPGFGQLRRQYGFQ